MLQTLLDSCAALGVPLTAAQAEKLCEFGARLLEQNRVMNLTAITQALPPAGRCRDAAGR